MDLVLEVTNLQNETVATTVDEVKDAPKKVSTGEVYITLFQFCNPLITVRKSVELIKLNFILANMDSCFNWRVSMWIFRAM